MFVSRLLSFTEQQLREAVAAAETVTETIRLLGLRPAGGNYATIKRYLARWDISTAHFDPAARRAKALAREPKPLEEVMTVNSHYKRSLLKPRLSAAGLKRPFCEMCGQGEEWRGRRMTLILDHINGETTDNRLENLRILCPNCNATLDTHCGKNKRSRPMKQCPYCLDHFRPKRAEQVFCSATCGGRFHAPSLRRVERPPREQLEAELAASNYVRVARRYGVSDNAIRKWERAYEWDEDRRRS